MRAVILSIFICQFSIFNCLSQDTISFSKLIYDDGAYRYQNLPFTGVAFVNGDKLTEYYNCCTGDFCGYTAYYKNGDTAAVHLYSGNDIHLIFYSEIGNKRVEYHQRILDQTYTFGEWKYYHDDGKLQVKGKYKLVKETAEGRGGIITQWKSVRDGIWEYYDEKGICTKKEVWKNDKMIKLKKCG